MHLLKIDESGALYDSDEAVDLGQPPGDIVLLTSADTEVSLLSAASERLRLDCAKHLEIRVANYLSLTHPFSVDQYIEKTISGAKLVVVRLLGGSAYWQYGTQQLAELAASLKAGEISGQTISSKIPVMFLSGDGKPDPELDYLSSFGAADNHRLAAYLDAGGLDNAYSFLLALRDLLDGGDLAPPPSPLLRAGIYWPQDSSHAALNPKNIPDLRALADEWQDGAPIAAIVFYRALLQAGDLAPIDTLITACRDAGMNPLPLFTAGLKDPDSAAIISSLLTDAGADVILNLTSFAVSDPAGANGDGDDTMPGLKSAGPFGAVDAPVFQLVLSASLSADWQGSSAGLTARDLAMNVALPELDGRILTRAIGFKRPLTRHALTHAMTTGYEALPDRAAFTARLAAGWAQLRRIPAAEKRTALIMANYPNRDGRLANGVGLDTPQSVFAAMQSLTAAGYRLENLPADSAELIARLRAGPTNAGWQGRECDAMLNIDDYQLEFDKLPPETRDLISARWGLAEHDPMCDGKNLHLPLRRFGNVIVAVQPARGYNIDPKSTYHSPDLVPPHNYFALYFWLRSHFGAHAVVHFGKHGNLEWLPGKALALSPSCFPEAVLGPMPHLYPFIVNDPGEGAQAKRRTSAVILDHLTPPMTQADSHGVMAELEAQMDEYFEAAGMDRARSAALLNDILETAERAGITKDCGINDDDDPAEKLLKLDNFLCDIKELQIRDGLHVFGHSPAPNLANGLLAQMLRSPRGDGSGANASLLRALAADLGLDGGPPDANGFDPLTAERALPWEGPRPPVLVNICDTRWRSTGDTVERLDRLAEALVGGAGQSAKVSGDVSGEVPEPPGLLSAAIINHALPMIRARLDACGPRESEALLRGLEGKFIPAGASGAPTRGRPEVLPTGRNFFSIDSRALPTPVAWRLGWASAEALLDRHLMEQGNWPRAVVLSVWGTSNMRTGGDDLAQALALMGVRPAWDASSRRVTGFEIIPLDVLDRPRVDVCLRASGFFRDAFPAQMTLFDRAVRAVAALDEPQAMNPLAATARQETAKLIADGLETDLANRQSTLRIFSAKPGAYGAGLQALVDEGIWQERSDFAEAFLVWSSYAYGEHSAGEAARGVLETRLSASDAILHNQDNREHDILDSDDYYQFAGGLSAAVAHLSGRDVPVYHNDHSLPERPVIRTLAEEIGRVVRGRASNPKWIAGAMRHGYKGAFEMAATVDYLFAFQATTRQVAEHHFTALYEAYIENNEVRHFLEEVNDAAYHDMLARFDEAIARGLWTPRRNSVQSELEALRDEASRKSNNQ
ncbi:cobaltochelatase subunit CobN [Alphaproteobacteria bacterium]|nr:cobaltochelatase subunit CobN [Alphaproteobacteria bacterium]